MECSVRGRSHMSRMPGVGSDVVSPSHCLYCISRTPGDEAEGSSEIIHRKVLGRKICTLALYSGSSSKVIRVEEKVMGG